MIELPVTVGHAREAMRDPKKPLCIVCKAQGRDVKATSIELHSCNNPEHVKQLRGVYRWAKGVAERATSHWIKPGAFHM